MLSRQITQILETYQSEVGQVEMRELDAHVSFLKGHFNYSVRKQGTNMFSSMFPLCCIS